MKLTLLVFGILVFTCYPTLSQQVTNPMITCSLRPNSGGIEQCKLEQENAMFGDAEAEEVVNWILSPIGLPANFLLVPCPNIKNALASFNDGIRYIIYDHNFMSRLDSSITDWASTSVLAHEIGHHLCGHSLKKSANNAEQREKELEADEFSGFVLSKLGASLDQATATISALEAEVASSNSSHPDRSERISSIEKGYNRGKINLNPVNIDYSSSAEEFFNKGINLYEGNKYQEALDMYTVAIGLKPDFANAYNNRGLVKSALEDYSGAVGDLSRAIQLNPDDADFYFNRGSLKDELQDYSGAIVDYSRAILLKPDYAEAFNNRGFSKDELQDYSGAIADYSRALQLKPDNAEVYLLNRGLAKQALQDLSGACMDYSKSCYLGNSVACNQYNINCQ